MLAGRCCQGKENEAEEGTACLWVSQRLPLCLGIPAGPTGSLVPLAMLCSLHAGVLAACVLVKHSVSGGLASQMPMREAPSATRPALGALTHHLLGGQGPSGCCWLVRKRTHATQVCNANSMHHSIAARSSRGGSGTLPGAEW